MEEQSVIKTCDQLPPNGHPRETKHSRARCLNCSVSSVSQRSRSALLNSTQEEVTHVRVPATDQCQHQMTAVILDLDGTLIDTESLCIDVARQLLAKWGVPLPQEACKAFTGRRPLEAWAALVEVVGLKQSHLDGNTASEGDPPASAEQLLMMSEPLIRARWGEARLLPGAIRLMRHLAAHGIPMALATSTPRATLNMKLATKPELRALIKHAVCGDEVKQGKPAPEAFLSAAALLGVSPESCLVVEDAPSGVEAALAAGMRVVMVPSVRDKTYSPPEGVTLLSSLLDFQPATHGLPAFDDLIQGAVPTEPILLSGEVVKGFGRGSKELGIPTANLSSEALADGLSDAVTGIWCGWASIGTSTQVYKMVMSIGFNPFYGNTHKTAEPWLLSELPDFYGEELRLVVVAYLRPEANFTSLEALITQIHADADVTKKALEHPALAAASSHTWLTPKERAASLAQSVRAKAGQE